MKRTLQFLMLLYCLILVSCSDSDDTADSPIAGNWRIASIKVSNATLIQTAPSEENITVDFQSGGNYTGNTTVNQFEGTFETENTTLTLLSFSTTEVADTQFGTAFYAAITEAQVPNTTFAQFAFQFDSGDLILTFGDGGEMVLE